MAEPNTKKRDERAKKRLAKKAVNPPTRGPKRGMRVTVDHPKHGRIEVRHMAASYDQKHDRVLLFSALDAATALADDAKRPVWIQMAKSGAFAGHPAGPFQLNTSVFEDIVRNFKATENQQIPIDFEHASEADASSGEIPVRGAPAQGWVRDLKVQGGNLYALVEWGDLARDYIKQGKYKFISPAIRFGSKDRVTGQNVGARLTSAGLTNQPFLDGMMQLAAKDGDAGEGQHVVMRGAMCYSTHEYMPRIKAALRLPELATAAQCSEHMGMLREHLEAAGGDMGASHQGVDLSSYLRPLRDMMQMPMGSSLDELLDLVEDLIDEAMDEHEDEDHAGQVAATDNEEGTTMADEKLTVQLSEATTKVSELTLKLTETTKQLADKDAEIKTLTAWKSEREQADLVALVDVAFETYKDSKGLKDADKAHMTTLCKAAPVAFAALYPVIKPSERHLLRNVSGDGVRKDGNGAPPSFGGEIPTQAQLADKHRKAGKSNEEAVSLAFAEHQLLLASVSSGR